MTQTPEIDAARIAALRDRLDRPVVLIGLMGSGKSTVGQRLATLLGTGFVDSDSEVEKAAQQTISEIFARFGEAHFRDGERRVIARLIDETHGVIATGGGAFMQDDTRDLILNRAIAVWLDCDVETLVARTARRDTRPLLNQGDPREVLTRLHAERSPVYAQAPIRIAAGEVPHHQTALRIVEALETWL